MNSKSLLRPSRRCWTAAHRVADLSDARPVTPRRRHRVGLELDLVSSRTPVDVGVSFIPISLVGSLWVVMMIGEATDEIAFRSASASSSS